MKNITENWKKIAGHNRQDPIAIRPDALIAPTNKMVTRDFIENYKTLRLKNHRTKVIRDGFIPLMWFFINNPRPPKKTDKIYIHIQFQSFVPEPWLKNVGFYRVCSAQKRSRFKELNLVSIFRSDYLPPGSTLRGILKTVSKASTPVFLHWHQWPETNLYSNKVEEIEDFFSEFSKASKSWKRRDFYELLWRDQLKNTAAVVFNSRLVLADCAIENSLAERGALLISADLNKKPIDIIPLSEFHCLYLYKPTHQTQFSTFLDFVEKTKRVYQLREKIKTYQPKTMGPWPEWFYEASRDYWKQLARKK